MSSYLGDLYRAAQEGHAAGAQASTAAAAVTPTVAEHHDDARAATIREVCDLAGRPWEADGLIASDCTTSEATATLARTHADLAADMRRRDQVR